MIDWFKKQYRAHGAPATFYHGAGRWMHFFMWPGIAIILLGWGIGFHVAPTHNEQGDVYRIIYLHVPTAWLALQVYIWMAIASGCVLIWRVKVMEVLAVSAAKVGMVFTAIALLTGIFWSPPTWNSVWQWDDVRLMSMLILLFLYIGLVVLYGVIDDKQTAARGFSIMAIVGVVMVPIIRFAVYFDQSTTHQKSLLSSDDPMDPTMLTALLTSLGGFVLFSIGCGLAHARLELLRRERNKRWVTELS